MASQGAGNPHQEPPSSMQVASGGTRRKYGHGNGRKNVVVQYSMTGFLFSGNNGPFFSFYLASFHPTSDSRAFQNPSPYPIPFNLTFRAASGGLLLGHPPSSSSSAGPFFIINPLTGSYMCVPPPNFCPFVSSPITPMALVAASAGTIRIVSLIPSSSRSSSFHYLVVFSSDTRHWSPSVKIHDLGTIDPRSGISCGTAAYFRTDVSPPALIKIGLGPNLHVTKMALPPVMPYKHHRQLGCIGGKLMLISSGTMGIWIHTFSTENQSWSPHVEVTVTMPTGWGTTWSHRLVPLRFESDRLEIPFWCRDQKRPVMLEEMDDLPAPVASRFPNEAPTLRLEKRNVPFDGPRPACVLDLVPYGIRPDRPSGEMDFVPRSSV